MRWYFLGDNNIGAVISKVKRKSIAWELGLEKGDRIIAINGQRILDILDYKFALADERLTIELVQKDGEKIILEVEKDFDEDFGVEFEDILFDGIKSCKNHCVFCFMAQSPKGMRKSLYLRDDDYRLSFLQGNYITLSNMEVRDWQKIINQHISPLYISVHTTNSELRKKMMRNERAGEILRDLKRLAKANIEMHIQIVLCPGINDGKELDRTINDMANLWPQVRTVSIVPVGITKHRNSLAKLIGFDAEGAAAVIAQVEKLQEEFKKQFDTNFVFLADEFFVLAGQPIPPENYYEGYSMLEDGIGLIRLFMSEFEEIEPLLPSTIQKRRRVTVVTGKAAYLYLKEVIERLNDINGLKVNLVACENYFYGEKITVAGLLTAKDVIDNLTGKDLGEVVILPSVMFKEGEAITLDDKDIQHLQKELQRKVVKVENNPRMLVEEILGCKLRD
jgi:putative radical SAM enzyme (TIGR03279 family)